MLLLPLLVPTILYLLHLLLDGNLESPLPSFLEEPLKIRPRSLPSAERAALPFAPPPQSPPPPSHPPPVLGWNSWNTFQCSITESLILSTASALVSTNLSLHYTYVNIDDCWQAPTRAPNGDLQACPTRFPRGIAPLAADLHAMGLKLGLYTDYGLKTCAGYPGSYDNYERDSLTFASWGVDLIKVDRCASTPHQNEFPSRYFRQFKAALDATGRDIVYERERSEHIPLVFTLGSLSLLFPSGHACSSPRCESQACFLPWHTCVWKNRPPLFTPPSPLFTHVCGSRSRRS